MNVKLSIGIASLALTAASILAMSAPAAPERTAGALQLKVAVGLAWRFSDSYCPPGTGEDVECVGFRGVKDVPGLGRITETYVKTLGDHGCSVTQFKTAVLEVAGKGAISLSMDGWPVCGEPAPAETGPVTLTITGGSGIYAGASGSLEFRSSVYAGNPACRCGPARDSLIGTLTVPGLDFDLMPPVLSGAVSKTVRAPKGAKRVRVRYPLKAQDAVGGTVRVECKPRSGSYFKLGRTKVSCSATDTSANTSRARFTITVRRASP
jgi:HYR domain